MGFISNPAPSVGTTIQTGELDDESVTAAKVKPTEIATLAAASNKFAGKVGFNNVAPATQAADTGANATNLSLTLITEVAAPINTLAGHVNDIRTCLRNHGLMA